jgi:hypothetical protein
MSLEINKETRLKLNTLAREQLKLKILTDLNIDMQICEIENWSMADYLLELQEMINSFLIKKS